METEIQETDGTSNEPGGEGERTQSVTTKAVRLVPIRVIRKDGPAALVEWMERGRLNRVVVPLKAISEGRVSQDDLDAGLPYAEDWSQVKGINAALRDELYRVGIWTKADMLAMSHKARNAVQQACVVPLVAALLDFAKKD